MSWEEMDVSGRFIATEILNNIGTNDFLVADISRLNFNVVYEIGFAIGKGKPILLVKHKAVTEGHPSIQDVGIFDTLGYKEYTTSDELYALFRDVENIRPMHISGKINDKTPIYLIQPKTKTDYDGFIGRIPPPCRPRRHIKCRRIIWCRPSFLTKRAC